MVIPNGAKVKVSGTKGEGDANRLVNVDGWGWTKATNLKGNFHGETLSRIDANFLSQDPAHKTVGNPNASIRTKGTSYPAAKPAATIPKGTIVKTTATGSDPTIVRVSALDGTDLGWTKKANLTAAADGTFKVNTGQATKRVETIGYSPTNTHHPDRHPRDRRGGLAGQRPEGRVRPRGEDQGGRREAGQGRRAWVDSASNLVDGWTEGHLQRDGDVERRRVHRADRRRRHRRRGRRHRARVRGRHVAVPAPAAGGRRRWPRPADRERLPHLRGAEGALRASTRPAPATRPPRPEAATTRTASPSTSTPRASTPPSTSG